MKKTLLCAMKFYLNSFTVMTQLFVPLCFQ